MRELRTFATSNYNNLKNLTPTIETNSNISSNCDFYVYGNIMSLVKSTNFATTTALTAPYTFVSLFEGNTHLKSHPSNQLLLPATTLTECCYNSMFRGCTGLSIAPALPATTLAPFCYKWMFSYCSSLTTAPALLAETLVSGCYDGMFNSCRSLNYVKCLAKNNILGQNINRWLTGVASDGIFVKAAGISWPKGNPSNWTTNIGGGIPSGWTVVEE